MTAHLPLESENRRWWLGPQLPSGRSPLEALLHVRGGGLSAMLAICVQCPGIAHPMLLPYKTLSTALQAVLRARGALAPKSVHRVTAKSFYFCHQTLNRLCDLERIAALLQHLTEPTALQAPPGGDKARLCHGPLWPGGESVSLAAFL